MVIDSTAFFFFFYFFVSSNNRCLQNNAREVEMSRTVCQVRKETCRREFNLSGRTWDKSMGVPSVIVQHIVKSAGDSARCQDRPTLPMQEGPS